MHKLETNATIWQSMRKKVIRPIIQQFLYKSIHGMHHIGKYWRNIEGYEERETCVTCSKTESMCHIQICCIERSTQIVWHLTKDLWPHRNIPWPEITLGTILGCGGINLQSDRPRGHHLQWQKKTTYWGLTWLLQILISEPAYII